MDCFVNSLYIKFFDLKYTFLASWYLYFIEIYF